MQKHWDKSKVDLYFDDIENEKEVRRSFRDAIEEPTEEQITEFTQAIDVLSDYPSSRTVLVQEFEYTHE